MAQPAPLPPPGSPGRSPTRPAPGSAAFDWAIRHRNLRIGAYPLIMGILNITPDSFSDGGRFFETDTAIAHGLELVAQGADLLDIGGESTRPGAEPVPLDEELRRVVPVVKELAKGTDVPISVDTSKAEVAEACLREGASIVNDVTALHDPSMAAIVRDSGAGIVLMHMQGTPATMQQDPRYDNVVAEVHQFLLDRIAGAVQIGIRREQIAVDPGIGFGKTSDHNCALIANLEGLLDFGRPICLGVSRKRVISGILRGRSMQRRLAGSLALLAHCLARRAVQVARVHDVEETRDLIHIFQVLDQYGHEPDEV